MSDADHLIKNSLQYKKKNKQMALKSLNNYIEQLKIHYDLNEKDVVRILRFILRVKNKNNFIKKLWNIFNSSR